MTPTRRTVHPRLGPLLVAYEAPDCPAWAEDDRGTITVEAIRAGEAWHREQLRAKGPAAGPGNTPAAKAASRRCKKDPHPDQIALIDTTEGGSSDGRYD